MLYTDAVPAPNLKDPRVQRRFHAALKWCDLHLSDWRPREIYANQIADAFGPRSSSLHDYLRTKLLKQTSTYLVDSHPCSYVLNRNGYEDLRASVGHLSPGYADVFPDRAKELETLEFEYETKSDRYWHPFQNIKRERKSEFWAAHGLPCNYDIAACAPTILLQLAKRKGISPLVAQPIEQYLQDRSAVRAHVASVAGISVEEAKRLINSFFNGAQLMKTPFCKAYAQYGGYIVEKLQKDRDLRRLRVAIRAMWVYIRRDGQAAPVNRLGMTINVQQRKNVRRSRDKWAIYFQDERAVMDVIKRYLTLRGITHFTEHDGFRTSKPVNLRELEAKIAKETGFTLTVEESKSVICLPRD